MDATRHDREQDGVSYRIVVAGRLGRNWLEWFGADRVEPGDARSVLWVRVTDQAELFGRLRRVQDLNLTLLEVTLASPTSDRSIPPDDDSEGDIP